MASAHAPSTDIRHDIEHGPMSALQIMAVAICWTINMLDGFDIQALAFVAPELGREWGIGPADLGWMFGAGTFGMMAGALLLAPFGDYIGRRTIILLGLITITIGMLATSLVESVPQMIVTRAVTGIGIGAILASLTSMTAEYSSARRRSFSISLMHMGYPVGAILGGLFSLWLIAEFGWRSVFVFGGCASALMIPVVVLLLPESLGYLAQRQPRGALERFNRILLRMGRTPVAALPEVQRARQRRVSVLELFTPVHLAPTLALWFAFFMCMLALYFLVSWTPSVVASSGLPGDYGRYAGILINAGGAAFMVVLGFLSFRFDLKRLIQIWLVASAVMIMIFAAAPLPTALLMLFAFLMGLEMAGMVGIYSLAAKFYPTDIRNTGVGWAIGMGRWGAVFGPVLAGWMIEAEFARWVCFLALAAAPALLAALALNFTPRATR